MPFDWLHVPGNIDYLVKETVFERQLRTRGDSYCLINWHCVDAYGPPTLTYSGLFLLIPDCWCTYERSRLFFLQTPIVPVYYPNSIARRRPPELIFFIAVSKFSVFALVSFVLSALFEAPVCFISKFKGEEDIVPLGVLLVLPEGVHNFV